jgi:hypothetical protein
MTNAQIFQLLGLAYFSMGVGMLVNPKFFKNIMYDLEHSTANVYYGGLICLAIGFPLVSFYNVWDLDSSLIITLLGWLSLAKGIALLMIPTQTMTLYKKMKIEKFGDYISYVIIILGVLFLYLGYFA